MVTKNAFSCLSVLLIFSGLVNAQGQILSSFDFLRLEPSAQASALGGALLGGGASQNSWALYHPALLTRDASHSMSASWLNHLSDLQAGTITYAQSFGTLGTAAAGIRYLHWGRTARTDEDGAQNGTFSSSNIALTTGFSRPWQSRIRYGANLHVAYSSVAEYGAVAVAVDAGVLYHIAEEEFTASMSTTNMGFTLSSLGQLRDHIPTDLRISVSKRLRYIPVLFGLTLHDLLHLNQITNGREGFRHAIFSFEFQAIPVFHIRMGYNHRKRNLKSERRLDLAGTSVGFGLRIRQFHLDYAYSSWSFSGLHQFTLTTKFRTRDQ